MNQKQVKKLAARLADGDLHMASKEYAELDPEIREAAHKLYQEQAEASEKERMEAARRRVQAENAQTE